jgi:hypothetical protein
MVKEMEVYQFNNISPPPPLFIFASYVPIWFPIVHHHLCQSQILISHIQHGHDKAHAIVHFHFVFEKALK